MMTLGDVFVVELRRLRRVLLLRILVVSLMAWLDALSDAAQSASHCFLFQRAASHPLFHVHGKVTRSVDVLAEYAIDALLSDR